MSLTRMAKGLALAGLVTAFAAGSAFAQAGGAAGGGAAAGGAGGGGGGGGGRGRFNPAQMQQRMEEQIKTNLAVTDDEWTAIQPLVDKVLTLQRETLMSRFRGGRGGRGGGGPGAAGAPAAGEQVSPLDQARTDLRTVLDNKDSTAADIAPKLKAYRDAKDKAHADLVAAQTALKQVLTARQEAELVQMGILD